MNLREAMTLVTEDVRATYPEMTDREVLEHVGSKKDTDFPETEDETDLNRAYRMVTRVYGPNGGFMFPNRPIPPLL